MQTCPNCNHLNRPGVVFCDNCGASLIGDAPLGTKSFGLKQGENLVNTPLSSLVGGAGSEIFNQGTVLRIEIEGSDPMLLKPQQETIFGRRDPATGEMPDVDLTPFAGYRMGVSRRHAAIRRTEGDRLDLWDLGSSNGTFLNGVRLAAHRPNKLHDGDQIRLGQMVIKVFFLAIPDNLVSKPGTSDLAPLNGTSPHKDSITSAAPSLSNTAPSSPVPSSSVPANNPLPGAPPAKPSTDAPPNDSAPNTALLNNAAPNPAGSKPGTPDKTAPTNVPPPTPNTPASDAPVNKSNDAPTNAPPNASPTK